MNVKKETKISVKYIRSNDFKFVAATGAYGGVNPQAEIICNFYVESRKYPETMKVVIDDEMHSFKEERAEEEEQLIRELQFGVVMRPDIAKTIGEWLIKESNKISSNVDDITMHKKEEEDKQ